MGPSPNDRRDIIPIRIMDGICDEFLQVSWIIRFCLKYDISTLDVGGDILKSERLVEFFEIGH